MEKTQQPVKVGYYGYPEAKEGPNTTYSNQQASNPVLRGIPLAIAGSLVTHLNLVSSFLWSNAGFNSLRRLDLEDYEPRYDPTVIPKAKNESTTANAGSGSTVDHAVYINGPKYPNRHYYTIADYHSAYESGKLTPTAVAQALLDLVPKHKAAFLDVKKDQVLAAAEASTQRYKDGNSRSMLDGVPVSVKDEVDLKGHSKSMGSSTDYTNPQDVTSWCVRKWEEAGAVIVGKLNMHEQGLDTTNNNPITGTPLNPHNPHYYTGGSSGGSAYATAAGLFPVTLGADGGGSIRIPAAYCGVYGLKPSHARVSGSPTIGLAQSTGVLGPIASSMADLEYAYRIMSAPNPSSTHSSAFPSPTTRIPTPPSQKLIGIYKPYFTTGVDPSVLSACNAALSYFSNHGNYHIIDIHLPYLPQGQLAHAMTILSEISSELTSLSSLTPANKILISVGKQTPATDFLLAQRLRNLLMQHLAFLFQKHPGLLIVTPTTPNAGWHISGGAADLKYGVSDANMSLRAMTYVWMANFSGCPSLTIPVGRARPKEGEGMVPVGLMAMGEWGGEEGLMEWGRVGEEWAWREGPEGMGKPGVWEDVLGLAGRGGSDDAS
ncbi:hypothetical protein JMJ35_008656 [Cladonia borealis]|uniref:Amidase domain-containing protein n=1 Tax=Cladonia borealis TaxID=184061 RepID=A0AA39QWC0_9LECA|nr:hypothetical protein JMJ35_008656 [Cladonia borealis]